MDKKQLALLGICNFVLLTIGGGLTGLLPVYLTRLGAGPKVTGLFLAFAFLALALSNLVGGRLSDYLQRRKPLLIVGGLLSMPITLLMSQATTVFQLTVLTGLLWLVGGLAGTMVNVLAGLHSEAGARGRVFGILGLFGTLGSFSGGLACGFIADHWGYPTLFILAALFYLIVPAAGFFVKDSKVVSSPSPVGKPAPRHLFANRTFIFLCCASILAHLANSEIVLCRPLLMNSLHYDATAISSAGGIGALLTLPLPLLVGWLSDRLGRKPFLILCYLTTTFGLLLLAAATQEWQFWAASALQSVLGVSVIVGSALITDQTPKAALGASLSLFTATPWIGFVVGFGGGGAAISVLKITPTLLLGSGLTLVAVMLLLPVFGTASRLESRTA
jgi:SET family sugar efflux transporter-like MFS transporter